MPGAPERDEVQRRLRGLDRPSDRIRGDHDLNPDFTPAPGTPLRPAAVLVPLVERPGGVQILLTRRDARLADHAGQISFPGGRIEPEDSGPEEAALREAEEEIGLARHHVEVVGRLDTYITRTGFRVTPVVAWVHGPFTLTPDPREVAEAFEVPLALLFTPALPRCDTWHVLGQARRFYTFLYEGRTIWGATAGMLVNLKEVLAAPC